MRRLCLVVLTLLAALQHTQAERTTKDIRKHSMSSRNQVNRPRNIFHWEFQRREPRSSLNSKRYLSSASDTAPTLKQMFQETTIRPGVYHSLVCVVQGSPAPHVVWTLDRSWPVNSRPGVRVNSYMNNRYEIHSYVNFTVLDVRDSGVYTCSANNALGAVSHSARLNVIGQVFTRPSQNVSIVEGQTGYVECPFGGFPFSNVKWERDGRTLPTNQRQHDFPNGTFAVAEVERHQDEGRYSCSVTGMDGQTAVTSFYIFVKVKPKVAPFAFQNHLQEGMRTAVTCVVLGGDPPIKLWWQKDGDVLDEADLEASVLSGQDGFVSTLTAKNLAVRHNGNYSCIAQNAVGTDTQMAVLRVKVPPRWILEPKDMSVIVGNSVTIDCQAEGVPEPHVRWKEAAGSESPRKNYRTLISSARIQILVNGSLSIRSVQKADAGSYLCEANNGVGAGLSTVIQLNVFSVPSTSPKFQSTQVVRGQQIYLNCSATGDLPVRFSWSKEGEHFASGMEPRFTVSDKMTDDQSVSTLRIESAERRDSGVFLCAARNDFGSDTARLQVKVQEKPDPPLQLEAKDVASRSATLRWKEAFTGNSPILRYIVMWRLADANWVRNIPPAVVPGTETSFTVTDLKPLTTYAFQVKAENNLGNSEFSGELSLTTLDEPPRFPPQHVRATSDSSQSITVIWEVPEDNSNLSRIDGFFVGIKAKTSREQYTFQTLDRRHSSKQEHRFSKLMPSTDYSIIVQAFNSKGPGPSSDEMLVKTLEYDPPKPPSLRAVASYSNSIQLNWVLEDNKFTPISGYKIYYKTDDELWQEANVGNATSSFKVRELLCGKKYGFYIVAFNKAGRSDPSKIVDASTDGSIPEAPEARDLFSINSTFIVVHLRKWRTGGCPISFFVIQYKQIDQLDWTLHSNNLIPQQENVYIYDLAPATWYKLRMAAHNDAGFQDREYDFGTLTLSGDLPERANSQSVLQKHFTITIPIASSLIVLIVVLLVVCFITRRRQPPRRLNSTPGELCEHSKAESVPLSVTGDQVCEPAYLSSPYGATRLVQGSQCHQHREPRLKMDDSLRAFGRPHSDHVYDVPFPVKRSEVIRSYPQYTRSPVASERDFCYKKPSYKKPTKRYRSRTWREDGDGSSGNESDSEYLSDVLMTVQKLPRDCSETESDRHWKMAAKTQGCDALIQGRSIVV